MESRRFAITNRMSKMIALMLDEDVLRHVDRERRRFGLSRARVVQEALEMWIERRRLEEAISLDESGYKPCAVRSGKTPAVLGSQLWLK